MATNQHSYAAIPVPPRPALFLDIDGTIAPLVSTPVLARIPRETLARLSALQADLAGAIALVSGRTIESIDALTAPQSFHAAGQHGLQIRLMDNKSTPASEKNDLILRIDNGIAPLQRLYPALYVENKGLSIAVHYRAIPTIEDTVRRYLQETIAPYTNEVTLKYGKMVCEVLLKGMNKGEAIQAMLRTPCFQHRTPIFIGDDVTDEDGFDAVNACGGISIKIGGGETAAHYHLANPEAVSDWLQEFQREIVHG